jgi:predicted nuclease with TOPRIM domain|tara:strand:+ start:775 stop:951 length:177 start_codon:yes stop_codon:yes gene_type:complete
MNIQERHKELVNKAIALRDELINMEKKFNEKKEEFLRIQGAISILEEQQTPVATEPKT